NVTELVLIKNGVGQTPVLLPSWGAWPAQGLVDANGDGKKDVLYQSGSTQYAVFLNGTTKIGEGLVSGKVVDAVTTMAPANEGTDTIISSVSYTLPTGVENLTLASGAGSINGTGNAAANVIIGNEGNNILTGGAGADTLTGNGGIDTFAFGEGDTGASAGTRDLITDFTHGTDQIDLTGIDADRNVSGQDAFHLTSAFDGAAGALRTTYDAAHNVTVLEGDTNGDNTADFGIELTGNVTLTTADFKPGSLL